MGTAIRLWSHQEGPPEESSKGYVTVRIPVLMFLQGVLALLISGGTVLISHALPPSKTLVTDHEQKILERLAVVETKVDAIKEKFQERFTDLEKKIDAKRLF